MESGLPALDLLPALAGALPGAALITDPGARRLLGVSPGCAALWRLPAEPTLEEVRAAMSLLAASPRLVAREWTRRAETAPEPQGRTVELLLRDGRSVRWESRALRAPSGAVLAELHTFEERPAETARAPREPDDLFRLTFEKASVGMALIAADLLILRANPSFCRMLGYEEKELQQMALSRLSPPDVAAPSTDWNRLAQSGQETFYVDRPFRSREGKVIWVHLSVSVVRDAQGRPVYFVAMAEDITRRRQEEQEQAQRARELQTLASTDPLTGLYNHRSMVETLQRRLSEARRIGYTVSILMLDLDHFRSLNERYGHDAGNRALRSLAEAMRNALRGEDIACRFGGEEFVMVLAGAGYHAALAAAERVRRRVEQLRPIGAANVGITCSIGVASYPAHASTVESLIKAADIALFEAKAAGRNRVCGYQPSSFEPPPDHVDQLGSTLRGASLESLLALVTGIDLRDRYTGAHSQRVSRLAAELAARLGCREAEIECVRTAGLLLDCGKVGLPDSILTSSGRLSTADWELMRQHPIWGEQLVSSADVPPEVPRIVRSHHERLDGSGYPDGLSGASIPRLVRIVSVADVAAALRDDRPHRKAWTRGRVLAYLRRQAGAKLDPDAVQAYCDVYAG